MGIIISIAVAADALFDRGIKNMDAVIVAVAHKEFVPYTKADMEKFFNPAHAAKVLLDLKGIYDMNEYKAPEFDYWRL